MGDTPRPLEMVLIVSVVAAAGVVRGFTGFGAGLLMVPAIAMVLGPVVAVPLVVLLECGAAVQLVPGALRQARWRTVAPLGLAALVAIPVGSRALVLVEPHLLRRLIGAVVVVFVIALAAGWRSRRRPTTGVSLATGAASGLLTGAAGIGGPPVILFYLSGPDAPQYTRASLICYFAITQAVALVAFAVGGLLVSRVLIGGLVLFPVLALGLFVGTRLFGHADERVFRGLALGLLAVVAAISIWA
jgi:uncharacterized membrane protein YfcA